MRKISRRELLLKTGQTVAGAAFLASPLHTQTTPQGTKPLFVPPVDAINPAAHSQAENLFWTDILMEHANFIMLGMQMPELASQRSQADQFRRSFSNQFDRVHAAAFDRANYAAVNRATADLIKPFIDFERSVLAAQQSGKVHTLIWPSFFEHTIQEAQRASSRLAKLSSGDVALDGTEVVGFWGGMMSDHGGFLAHLLDPKETELIATALDSAAQFSGFRENAESKMLRRADVLIAAEELIDFKTATLAGIETGAISSIISPMFADHVRREALKFVDELRRSEFRTD